MEFLWFVSLSVGLLPFAFVCLLWRHRLASSWPRRLLASVPLAIPCTPAEIYSHGPSGVFPAMFLISFDLWHDSAGELLADARPFLITTAILFITWSLWLGAVRLLRARKYLR